MSTDHTVQNPPALQGAKAATKALIKAAGGQEEAEGFTGKSQSQLSKYGLPNTDVFITIDAVIALEAVTHGMAGHPHVTRFLAQQAGGVFVRLPQASAGATDWHVHMGAVSKEVSDVIQGICEALADQSVTPAEARKIRAEIAEAQERLSLLDALAKRAEGDA
ncbi:phage regulatory CII family protein [Sphingosinicella sp. BN140058]|uniref:phage regulatory CII family protein n=1 Tax=Sphingosinicella sp. BN140058 TaxID=1892855 RepID=UPI0010116C1B|nr:phage regulatory CII family protein [Sphingosinicella sp. BN140058]QAY77902.1 hypothetical protein ETR14_16275 [Sphingosinicella sp. BN140058]